MDQLFSAPPIRAILVKVTVRGGRIVIAFDDAAIARLLIAATRFERDADRTALLRKFADVAERRPWQSSGGVSTEPNVSVEKRPRADQLGKIAQSPRRPRARSPAAVNQAPNV